MSLLDNRRSSAHADSWRSTWAFFMRNAAARDWLFQREPPPISQTVNSLLSSPVLVGYIFGDEVRPNHSYPDIGDLLCVHHRSGDTVFCLHYGYQSVQPLVPMLYQISGDPLLRNSRVTSRRAVKQRVNLSNTDCFLALEFNWLESGVLAVSTFLHPIVASHQRDQTSAPFFRCLCYRVFSSASAERLMQTHHRYRYASKPPFNKLPAHFLDPPDDCYIYTLREPIDSADGTALATPSSNSSPRPKFTVEQHIQLPSEPCATVPVLKRPRANNTRDMVPGLEAGTVQIWNPYSQMIAQSDRTGSYYSYLCKRFGGRRVQPTLVYDRIVKYTILSTTGINTYGRIQHLCSQLGILDASPLLDNPFQQFFEDDDLDEWHSIFEQVGQGAQLFDNTADADPRMLSGNEQTDVIPFFDEDDLQIRDVSNSVAPDRLSVSASFITGAGSMQKSSAQQARNLPLPKRQRQTSLSEFVQFQAPQPGQDITTTPPQTVSQYAQNCRPCNVPPRVLGSPLFTFDSHRASSSHPTPFQGSNMASVQSETGVNTNSTVTTGLDSGNVSGGPSSRNGSTAAAAAAGGCSTGASTTMMWACDQCGVLIRGKKGNLNRHIANKHDKIRNFECSENNCGRKFQTRLNLERHHNAVHLGRPFACAECPRTFKTERDLALHVRSAHDNSTDKLECEVCKACFARRSTLNRHLAKVHKLTGDGEKL